MIAAVRDTAAGVLFAASLGLAAAADLNMAAARRLTRLAKTL